tara:strand:- start:89 stop:403 length:315 start_codon:yes stop_codon:yes gene_type:complete
MSEKEKKTKKVNINNTAQFIDAVCEAIKNKDYDVLENLPDLCGCGCKQDMIDSITINEKLDTICDPEPLSGYTLLDEIEFTLYSAQSELNRLQKLIFKYKDQQD